MNQQARVLLQSLARIVRRRLGPRLIVQARRVVSLLRMSRTLAELLFSLARHGVVLRCPQVRGQGDILVRLDGIITLTGIVASRWGVPSVAVFWQDRPVARAVLTPTRPGSLRLPPWLARFVPRIFSTYFARMYCLVDIRHLPFDAEALTLIAATEDGRRATATLDLDRLFLPPYAAWRKEVKPSPAGLLWMARSARHFTFRPLVSLMMPLRSGFSLAAVRATLRSLGRQAYACWQLRVLCDAAAHAEMTRLLPELPERDRIQLVLVPSSEHPAELLEKDPSDLVGPIDAGDVLDPEALFELVYAFNKDARHDLVYADEDTLTEDHQRLHPQLKPDWSPELLLTSNYIGRPWLTRRELLARVQAERFPSDPTAEYDLLLCLTEQSRAVGHVRTVLCGRHQDPTLLGQAPPDQCNVVEAALERRQVAGTALPGLAAGTVRIRRALAERPLVSVILTLRKGPAARCLDSLAARTTYASWELIVLADGVAVPASLPSLGTSRYRVLPCAPGLGHTRLCNQGAAAADGSYLVFLENAEVLTPDWIEALLELAQSSDVGVVGGRIVNERRQLEHAGYFLVDHAAGSQHAFHGLPLQDPGMYRLAAAQRECSAVSSACLMVRRQLFEHLCGFDDKLPGRQADVDFCLRTGQAGQRILTTPHAVVSIPRSVPRHDLHVETSSPIYWERWQSVHALGDPYHHPGLSPHDADYGLNMSSLNVVNHSPRPMIDRTQVQRILLVKLDHLGDMMVALPVIRRLRQLFPDAHLTALVSAWVRPLLEQEGLVDCILTFEFYSRDSNLPPREVTPQLRRELAELLRPGEYDLAIDLRWDPDTRFVLSLSGATYTAGYADLDGYPWLTLAVPYQPPPSGRPGRLHITQLMHQLIESIEVACQSAPMPAITGKGSLPTAQDRLLAALSGDQQRVLVAIHAGAGNPLRRWPPERFAELADRLITHQRAAIVFVGSPGEVPLIRTIVEHMRHPEQAVSLAGQVGIDLLPAALERCDLFIGSDSGPGHVAAAVGVPTVTIFAGTMHPQSWGPIGADVLTIRHQVPCSPCYFTSAEKCTKDWICMRHLHVEHVWEAAVRALLPRSAEQLRAPARSAA